MKSLLIAMLVAALPALAQGPKPAAPTPTPCPPPCAPKVVCPAHAKHAPAARPAPKAPGAHVAQKAYERGYQQGFEAGFQMAVKLIRQHHPHMAPGPKAGKPGCCAKHGPKRPCLSAKPGMKPLIFAAKPLCPKHGMKPGCPKADRPGGGCCGPVVKPVCPQPSKPVAKPACPGPKPVITRGEQPCPKAAPAPEPKPACDKPEPKPEAPVIKTCTKAFINGVEVDPATVEKMMGEMMSKVWNAKDVSANLVAPASPSCKVPPVKGQVKVFVNGVEVEPSIRIIGPKPAEEPAPAPEPQPEPQPAPAPQA